jgi:replicative DNA helicase
MEIEEEIDIEIVAKEFGQTKEELIQELDEAHEEIAAGKGIELDVDNLDEMFKS